MSSFKRNLRVLMLNGGNMTTKLSSQNKILMAPENKGTNGASRVDSAQLYSLLAALQAAESGDFSIRLPDYSGGVMEEIARTFNSLVSRNESMNNEIIRIGRIVGREGR